MPETKNVLVLMGGELTADYRIVRSEWDRIIVADGGLRHLVVRNVLPDWVVGDFDSVAEEWMRRLPASTKVERLPREKDVTDGELAVDRAMALRPRRIVLAGALGGRFDHALTNILLLARIADHGTETWATDGRQRIFLLRSEVTLEGEVGDTISIVPLWGDLEGVETQGLRWALVRERLGFATGRGVSNVITAPRVRVTCRNGLGLVIHTPRQYVADVDTKGIEPGKAK